MGFTFDTSITTAQSSEDWAFRSWKIHGGDPCRLSIPMRLHYAAPRHVRTETYSTQAGRECVLPAAPPMGSGTHTSRMHTHRCVCMYIYIYMYLCIYICLFIYVHTQYIIYIHICFYSIFYICVCGCTSLCSLVMNNHVKLLDTSQSCEPDPQCSVDDHVYIGA